MGRIRGGDRLVPGVDVQRPYVEGPELAGHPRTARDGHHAALLQADLPAVEELGRVHVAEDPAERPAGRPRDAATREAEDPLPFEEELALLREEERETGQVDLPLVHFHLREIRVVGEVGRQVLGDPVLDVDPAVAAPLVDDRRARRPIRHQTRDGIRLDLEGAARRRRLEADQRAGGRDPEYASRAHTATGRDGEPGQVDPLVLPPDAAPDLDAPEMWRLRAVAQALERNLHLKRPAAVEAAGPHVPDRIPVGVGVALVGELLVRPCAERIGVEVEAVAAVVEGVEEDSEGVVLAKLVRVAPHLVGDPLALGRRIPDARRDVHVLVIEEDPRLGPLGRRRARVRHQLDEAADGRDRPVDGLVEHAVELDGLVQPDRTDRHPALLVAVHHSRRDGRRRAIDESRIDHSPDLRLGGRRLFNRCGNQEHRYHRDELWWHDVPPLAHPAPSALGRLHGDSLRQIGAGSGRGVGSCRWVLPGRRGACLPAAERDPGIDANVELHGPTDLSGQCAGESSRTRAKWSSVARHRGSGSSSSGTVGTRSSDRLSCFNLLKARDGFTTLLGAHASVRSSGGSRQPGHWQSSRRERVGQIRLES